MKQLKRAKVGTRGVGVALERWVVSELDKIASAHGLTRSAIVRMILRAWLAGDYKLLELLRREAPSKSLSFASSLGG
ncbi:MAG: hypothetical protein DRK00_06220 [Thermoprotei archaeon]|nr:MAG: hypothetical protein DRK00_06220 [Thermoprotei archaeon]